MYKAYAHEAHPPITCESIASSSPINLWECPQCHYTYLALQNAGYTCTGGYSSRIMPLFGSRSTNIEELQQIWRYSKETGSEQAYDYHYEFISNNSRFK